MGGKPLPSHVELSKPGHAQRRMQNSEMLLLAHNATSTLFSLLNLGDLRPVHEPVSCEEKA